MALLCGPGSPGIFYVDQADLELRSLHVSAPKELRIKAITLSKFLKFKNSLIYMYMGSMLHV